MPFVPGTQVRISFLSFPNQHPDLYYAPNTGAGNLGSLNAGNSVDLYVDGGGVNQAFQTVLKAAGQDTDAYQSLHQQLLARANGGTAFETYTSADPCAFSYVNATQQVGTTQNYLDGVCFVDVFDKPHYPNANAKNVAMIYVAPPYGDNYATDAAFVTAIEATAEIVVETIAGYNAIAPQHGMPLIEVLRSTVYSSNIYNRKDPTHKKKYSVDPGDIGKTI